MKPTVPKLALYLMPRMQDLVFIMVFLLGILTGPRFFGDGDPGRHIVIGKIIVTEHTIPKNDIFSFTKTGQSLTTTEWLSEVLYAVPYLFMGLNGVVLLAVILIAATITLMFRETVIQSNSYFVAGLLAFWATAATFFHWLARPHLFSWLLFAIWVPAMDRVVRGEKVPIWQFPLIMLVWANLHGGFILGFLVWFAYLAGWAVEYLFDKDNRPTTEIFKRLLAVGGLSFPASLVNPSMLKLWSNVFGHVGDSTLMQQQIDWRSPDFHAPNVWPFLLLIALMLFVLAAQKRKPSSGQLFLLIGLTLLGLYSVRNIPFWVIACSPIIGGLLGFRLGDSKIFENISKNIHTMQTTLRGVTWNLLIAILTAAALLSGQRLDSGKIGNTFNPDQFPVQAADWLTANPQAGNMFNEFTWGGYLLYRFWPEQPVFIDGQTDFYGAELVNEYLTTLRVQKGWQDILQKYDVSWAIIPTDFPMVEALQDKLNWQIVYQDDTATILHKP